MTTRTRHDADPHARVSGGPWSPGSPGGPGRFPRRTVAAFNTATLPQRYELVADDEVADRAVQLLGSAV
jgi:hypothetical protein